MFGEAVEDKINMESSLLIHGINHHAYHPAPVETDLPAIYSGDGNHITKLSR